MKQLFQIKNVQDNYCLFYALQATLDYNIANMDKRRFYDYLRRSRRFLQNTTDLMNSLNAPRNLKKYDVKKYGNLAIDQWNQHYAGQHIFKLFVFGAYGSFRPLHAYGPENYTVPIILYFDNEHFDGVRRASDIFGQPYCLSCEKIYDRPKTHDYNCKRRCLNCSRVGTNFPCKPANNFYKKCSDCHKHFNNENCYNHHKRSNFCNNSKKCEDCGKTWTVKVTNRNGGHVCGDNFCNICHTYHNATRSCFIEPLEPKQQAPYRLIAFDCETKQHNIVDPSNNKRRHEVNFIGASIACANCIDSGKWRKSLNGSFCSICGKHRTVAFAEHDFDNTNVDKKVITSDPMKSFVKWLLYELPLNHESVIYSHYGGRLVIRGGNWTGKKSITSKV